jgi:hypothetical protein
MRTKRNTINLSGRPVVSFPIRDIDVKARCVNFDNLDKRIRGDLAPVRQIAISVDATDDQEIGDIRR